MTTSLQQKANWASYMRDHRRGIRRGKPTLSLSPKAILMRSLRASRRQDAEPSDLLAVEVYRSEDEVEEPMGPQEIPAGMVACGGCDILTRRPGRCGYCAAEFVREAA